MRPDPPPARWTRFTIRRALLAVALAALATLSLAGIDPFRRDPIRAAVAEAEAWCASGTADFTTIIDGVEAPVACMVKFVDVGQISGDRSSVRIFDARGLLTGDGEFAVTRQTIMGSHGWPGERSPARVAATLATLPPSAAAVPVEHLHYSRSERPWYEPTPRGIDSHLVLIGSRERGAWTVRRYDRRHLPAAVVALLKEFSYAVDRP